MQEYTGSEIGISVPACLPDRLQVLITARLPESVSESQLAPTAPCPPKSVVRRGWGGGDTARA